MYLGFHFVVAKPDCFFCVTFKIHIVWKKTITLCKNVVLCRWVCGLRGRRGLRRLPSRPEARGKFVCGVPAGAAPGGGERSVTSLFKQSPAPYSLSRLLGLVRISLANLQVCLAALSRAEWGLPWKRSRLGRK